MRDPLFWTATSLDAQLGGITLHFGASDFAALHTLASLKGYFAQVNGQDVYIINVDTSTWTMLVCEAENSKGVVHRDRCRAFRIEEIYSVWV